MNPNPETATGIAAAFDCGEVSAREIAVAALHAAIEQLAPLELFESTEVEGALRAAAEHTGEKPGDLFMLCRVAVTGVWVRYCAPSARAALA